MHEVLVNRLGGLSLPRKSVVRLTDRPDMTLDVYRGRKTTNQQQLSLLMRHLVIGQRQKAPNFSAFHWSPRGCLITIGQHFVTTRVVHLPKRTKTSLITESDQSRANHQLLQLCTVRTAWSDSDQAVRAVHSCKSWFQYLLNIDDNIKKPQCTKCVQNNLRIGLTEVYAMYKSQNV